MSKYTIINFIIGGAIAVILSVLLVLGLRIFVPPPEYPSYSYGNGMDACPTEDPACYERQQREYRVQQEKYEKDSETYGGKIFIAANIAGLIILLVGITCFAIGLGTNVGAGIILAGAFGISFGYVWGWNGADDTVKFGVGVIVALIVIAGGVLVNYMHARATTIPTTSL